MNESNGEKIDEGIEEENAVAVNESFDDEYADAHEAEIDGPFTDGSEDSDDSITEYRIYDPVAKRRRRVSEVIDRTRHNDIRRIAAKDPSSLDTFGPRFKLQSPDHPTVSIEAAISFDLYGILIEEKVGDGPNVARWFGNRRIHPAEPIFSENVKEDALEEIRILFNGEKFDQRVKYDQITIRYMNCQSVESDLKMFTKSLTTICKMVYKKMIVENLTLEVGDEELLEAFLANIKVGYLRNITITNYRVQADKVAAVSKIINSGHWKYLHHLFIPGCRIDVPLSQLIDAGFEVNVDATNEEVKKYIRQVESHPHDFHQRINVEQPLTMKFFVVSNAVTAQCPLEKDSDFCVISNVDGSHYAVTSEGKSIQFNYCSGRN